MTLDGAVRVVRSVTREVDRQGHDSTGRGSGSLGHGLGSSRYDSPGDLILAEAGVIGITVRDGIAAPHAVDHQVVRACRDCDREACGQPGAVSRRHQISSAVVEGGRNIEIRSQRGRIHRERNRSGAGLKGKHIHIGALFDDSGRADIRAGKWRGRADGVAMVVRAIADSICLHDGEVVFAGVVRVRVFTLAPLRDFMVVTHSHDGSPVALTGVITDCARPVVM